MSPAAPSRRERRDQVPRRRDDDRRERPIQRPRRPGCDACRLDRAIEAGMELAEALIVQAVTRLVHVEQREYQSRFVGLPSDTARRLNVFGCGLRLSLHDHQAEALDVEAD
jgi:hypothetical protein